MAKIAVRDEIVRFETTHGRFWTNGRAFLNASDKQLFFTLNYLPLGSWTQNAHALP